MLQQILDYLNSFLTASNHNELLIRFLDPAHRHVIAEVFNHIKLAEILKLVVTLPPKDARIFVKVLKNHPSFEKLFSQNKLTTHDQWTKGEKLLFALVTDDVSKIPYDVNPIYNSAPDTIKSVIKEYCGYYGNNFSSANLEKHQFPKPKKSELDYFKGARFRYAKLKNAVATECNFESADLTCADCQNMNLQRASLKQAILVKTNLCGANLIDADLSDVVAVGVKFDSNTLLIGAKLSDKLKQVAKQADAVVSMDDFYEHICQLILKAAYQKIFQDLARLGPKMFTILDRLRMDQCIVTYLNEYNKHEKNSYYHLLHALVTNDTKTVNADKVSEAYANKNMPVEFRKLITVHCRAYYGKNFRGANLENSKDFSSDSELRKALFSQANLKKANLMDKDLSLANFYSANMQSAELDFSDLEEVDLSGANCEGAYLIGTNLKGVKFSNSTNFSSAILIGAKLPYDLKALAVKQGAILSLDDLLKTAMKNDSVNHLALFKKVCVKLLRLHFKNAANLTIAFQLEFNKIKAKMEQAVSYDVLIDQMNYWKIWERVRVQNIPGFFKPVEGLILADDLLNVLTRMNTFQIPARRIQSCQG